MPAGLLLSLTARPVRTGPGMEPSRRRCRRPQVPLPRWQERPAARLGALVGTVPFSVTRRPLPGLRLRAFRSYRPRPAFLPRHPRQDPAMASLPCLGRHASFPASLSREYRSRRLPATCSSLSQPHTPFCFPLPGPSSHQYVRPAPSRPEDCALNQHFSSHPGTFVQRKMIL